jgi:hypothetical protein
MLGSDNKLTHDTEPRVHSSHRARPTPSSMGDLPIAERRGAATLLKSVGRHFRRINSWSVSEIFVVQSVGDSSPLAHPP